MNARRDPDRLIHAFLMEGQTELADPIYDAVRATIEDTHQRVVIGPWRTPDMTPLLKIALPVAAVLVVAVVGFQLLGGPNVGGQPTPTPAVTPGPTSAPTAAGIGLPLGPFVIPDTASGTSALAITVTIPAAGWFSPGGPAAVSKGEDGDPPEAIVLAWFFPAGSNFYVYGDPCKWESTKPTTPATTPAEIAAALAAQASRDASAPVDVTVGGYTGKTITLHVPNDAATRAEAFADCDQNAFASYGVDGDALGRNHQGPGQIDELWILNVGDAIVIIDATYRPSTSAELIEELRAIATSATFKAK